VTSVDVVVPTVGRGTLALLLASLDGPPDRLPRRVIVVDDRPSRDAPLATSAVSPELRERLDVVASPGHGAASARNRGWRVSRAEWVAFLDDDVIPCRGWLTELAADLDGLPPDVAGSRGRLLVSAPSHGHPSDRARAVRELDTAWWRSANVAFRTSVLEQVGGFDDRVARTDRSGDVSVRMRAAGFRIVDGRRLAVRPLSPARAATLAARRNDGMHAHDDDGWRAAADVLPERFRRHALVTAAGTAAALAGLAGHPLLAVATCGAWLAGTAELTWARIAGRPHTPREVAGVLASSACIPPIAVWHRLRGALAAARARGAAWPERRPDRIDAVLFGRDGMLAHDLAAGRDPGAVRPLAGAREAVQRLRAAGMRVAVVTNRVAHGDGAVNARVDALLGPFDAWLACPHAPGDGCTCRTTPHALVRTALRELDVAPERCAFVGDTGADVEAALAAGVRPILVPNDVTRRDEIAAAPEVARDLVEAADRLLEGHA
jgi:HAD superfamily hydrolase (TIGR01662 family)